MAWVPIVQTILSIVLRYVIPIVMGGIAIWWLASSATSIQQGVQQAIPGIGAAVGSIGMLFSLLPVMMMYMMLFSMMTMFMKIFE